MDRTALNQEVSLVIGYVQGIKTTNHIGEGRKMAALLRLRVAQDMLNRQRISPHSLNVFASLLMNVAVYAGAGNVADSTKEARKAKRYLIELHKVGKVDESDFRAISDKLTKYIATEDMNALDILGG